MDFLADLQLCYWSLFPERGKQVRHQLSVLGIFWSMPSCCLVYSQQCCRDKRTIAGRNRACSQRCQLNWRMSFVNSRITSREHEILGPCEVLYPAASGDRTQVQLWDFLQSLRGSYVTSFCICVISILSIGLFRILNLACNDIQSFS